MDVERSVYARTFCRIQRGSRRGGCRRVHIHLRSVFRSFVCRQLSLDATSRVHRSSSSPACSRRLGMDAPHTFHQEEHLPVEMFAAPSRGFCCLLRARKTPPNPRGTTWQEARRVRRRRLFWVVIARCALYSRPAPPPRRVSCSQRSCHSAPAQSDCYCLCPVSQTQLPNYRLYGTNPHATRRPHRSSAHASERIAMKRLYGTAHARDVLHTMKRQNHTHLSSLHHHVASSSIAYASLGTHT